MVSSTDKTRTVKDASNTVCTVTQEKYQNFAWGQEMVQRVEDPNGDALTATWTYYTNPAETGRYSRVHEEVHADGSWATYDYDDAGLVSVQVSGFKDAAVGSAASQARATYYDYSPRAGEPAILSGSPRAVTETILGITNAITYYSYAVGGDGGIVETSERAASATAEFGSSNNLRTVTTRLGGSDLATQGRTASVLSPDGRLDTYEYLKGTYATNGTPGGGTFTTNSAGTDVQTTLTHGTADHPEGIANKTTREVTVENLMGQTLLQETYVYTGSGYERIGWTDYRLDVDGHATDTYQSDGSHSEASWGCCGKDYEKDGNGVEHFYDYDALNRLTMITKMGIAAGAYPAQVDIYTDYAYDADGRQLKQTIIAGGLSQVSSNTFDLAGRHTKSTDSAGLVTEYDYANGGRTETVTMPGGGTQIRQNYLDGRTKSVNGTAVIATFADYGINSDGTQWTTEYTGPDGAGSPVWIKTTSDMLGHVIRTERPGYGGGIVTNTISYNATGQRVRTTEASNPAMLYEYDELGNQVRSGLDVNNNGALDLAGSDRISDTETYYEFDSSDWWQVAVSKVYATAGSATATTNSVSRRKVTGLTGGTRSVASVFDILGNQTVSSMAVDRNNKTVTQTTDYPNSNIDAVSVTVNDLLQSSTTAHGSLFTYSYDALGRPTGQTDPRTGASVTHYNSLGQIDYTEDAAGNRTTYAYDSATGWRTSSTDALTNTIYLSYDLLVNVTNTWGATYPVAYQFDAYGRKTAMSTWRNTNGSPDLTQWHFDPATGLLTNKVYAAPASHVTYTYSADGKLATRVWARGITTTYGYTNSGELVSIDYSDSTPDVGFTLNRLGQQVAVTDGTGSRAFTYNDALQLAAETNVMGEISRQYDAYGRTAGFNFTAGGTGQTYAVAYGYDTVGRFCSVSSSVQSASSAVNYSYLPNSDLISTQQLTANGSLLTATSRSYEDHRNLLTQVKNQAGTNLISQFDYSNDAVGRRIQRIDSSAPSTSSTNYFGYNSRSELITALMGTNSFGYFYDAIGNRETSSNNAETLTYHANELNQYTNIHDSVTKDLSYDLDGNLTNNGIWAYAWDGENRMIAVEPLSPSNGSKKVAMSYDYMSRRVGKVASAYDGTNWVVESTNRFAYDSWNLLSEIAVTPTPPYAVTNSYTWGLDLSGSLQGAGGIGGLVAAKLDTNSVAYCYDGNGNVSEIMGTVNGEPGTVGHYEYSPFGETIVATGPLAENNPFRFSTKYVVAEIGMGDWGRRWYIFSQGRWLSRDPVEERGGMNLYGFVANRPMDRVDRRGLLTVKPGTLNLGICGGFNQTIEFEDYEGVIVQYVIAKIEYTVVGSLDKDGKTCCEKGCLSYDRSFYEIIHMNERDLNSYPRNPNCTKGKINLSFVAKVYPEEPPGFKVQNPDPTGGGGKSSYKPPKDWDGLSGSTRKIDVSWNCWTGKFDSKTIDDNATKP